MNTLITGREVHPVIPLLKPEILEALRAIDPAKEQAYFEARRETLLWEQKDPFRNGYEPEVWRLADKQVEILREQFPVGVVEELDLGGNRACLVKGSLIYDPVEERELAIENICDRHHVLAWNGQSFVPAMAERPFSKGVLDCRLIQLEDWTGKSFRCSWDHRLLAADGTWIRGIDAKAGTVLMGGLKVDFNCDTEPRECYDFHVPGYENYVHAGAIHHNSKTERAAKRVAQLISRKANSKVWCLQSTQSISRQSQQPLIWKYLPPEWKPATGRGKRDIVQKMNYTQAGGFTEDTFVLPNGSQVWFKFYSVALDTVEGPELDAAWADELIPPEWLEFLRYRLVTRNGILHTTFTPVEGYSATVKTYLDRAKTIEEVEAPLLPIRGPEGDIVNYEKVPRIQQSGIERARIVYFHTKDNPYGNYESMVQTLRGKSRETILMRAYGVPSKTFGAALPLFRENVHVISQAFYQSLLKTFPNPARYHLVDPCPGRNWFQIWVACFPNKKKVIYREWPSYGHPKAYINGIGDPDQWALPGKPFDGVMGPAQNSFGFGLERYIDEIRMLEGNEVITDRFMDARSANLPTQTREGTTTLIQEVGKLGIEFLPATCEKSIFNNSDGSLDMINSALYYDQEVPLGAFSKTLSKVNEPELTILETCPNVIYSMSNWTGKDGQQGACKDPIDTVRMIYLSECEYISESALQPRQPWVAAFR